HVLVDLVVGQEALGLAHVDELALLALGLLGGGRRGPLAPCAVLSGAARSVFGGSVAGNAWNFLALVVVVVGIGFVVERVVHVPLGPLEGRAQPFLYFP